MTLKIEFETDNAAFDTDKAAETARILHEIADQISDGWDACSIRDINGNRIGAMEVSA